MLTMTLWPRPSHRSSDSQQRWHDVMMSWSDCHVIWHDHIEEAGLLKYILSPPSPLSLMTPVYLFLFDHLLAPAITLSSVQSTLVSALDPLLPPTPGHSPLPANCQPRVPVDHSALCPAAAISHPKKPLLLPPPSLLKSAIWSQDRCPLYKLCPGWPCPLDRPVEFYIFSPKIC